MMGLQTCQVVSAVSGLCYVVRAVFTMIEGGSASLQGKQANFSEAEEVIKA